MSFHRRYRELVGEIERTFPVHEWRNGDVHIWPLARMALYLDMRGTQQEFQPAARSPHPVRRLASDFLRPVLNLWRSRGDLAHWRGWPRRADAILLGDGVSLDPVDGAWEDSFGEPLAQALELRGESLFLMQRGGFDRLPWRRATFAANVAESWGRLLSWTVRCHAHMPQHDEVMGFLAARGVTAPYLRQEALIARAVAVSASAFVFAAILRLVRPKMAFIVNYFSGLGPAFVLACRRRDIPCVDLQRAPQEVAPMAYGWETPPDGYGILPELFWTWSAEDAASTNRWSLPRHRAFHGGDPRLARTAQDATPRTNDRFEREILVALQPIGGHRADWATLTGQIRTSPRTWRWWIRRHPASSPLQDAEFGPLPSLRGPNVKITEASSPLMRLLPAMDVLLCLESGAAVEAATFGLPVIFLSPTAGEIFPEMIARGEARVARADTANATISQLPVSRSDSKPGPVDLGEALSRLFTLAKRPGAAGACHSLRRKERIPQL